MQKLRAHVLIYNHKEESERKRRMDGKREREGGREYNM